MNTQHRISQEHLEQDNVSNYDLSASSHTSIAGQPVPNMDKQIELETQTSLGKHNGGKACCSKKSKTCETQIVIEPATSTEESSSKRPVTQQESQGLFAKMFSNYAYGIGVKQKEKRKKYRQRYNWRPNCNSEDGGPPYFSFVYLILFIVCYCQYNTSDIKSQVMKNLTSSPFIYKPELVTDWKEFYRYYTYSFMHANFNHILSNSLVFVLIGPILELGHDTFRPWLIYTVGCIMGSLFAGLVSPNNYLVGASGGCYALVAAH